jgi:TolB protein
VELAIHFYDYKYQQEQIVTQMGTGIVYDPEWSPVGHEIAFVATETGNDEIWVINHDGTQPRQLTYNEWEWDKSPSWSPDGSQIVFASNRTGNNQLWVMNADGSDQRLLMGWDNWTPYNDSAPVWVKYSDPAPISVVNSGGINANDN